ncbi:MAG: 2-C-methyl-D-erythritol 4-phosphate cytidylyltransferase, partial [Bacteroidetes bacterium]
MAVVVPAAGQGRRLGGPRKQFRSLGGRPLLVQTLLVFERHPAIDYLLVAAPAEAVRPLEEALRAEGLTKLAGVVEGGATRQASVRAGLRRVPAEVAYVLVHDAVRPFVHADEVSRLLRQVRRFGAASLVSPVADTLRRARGGLLAET